MSRAIAELLFGERFAQIDSYVDLLGTSAMRRGLIGPREVDRLWDRHVLNSVAIASLLPEGASVADVGSGAGLPGLPLAILRPDLTVTLVEPLLRRSTFLDEAVAELALDDRVTCVRSRAEDWREHVDVVTCRAVAPLTKLLDWTMHLWRPGGMLVALKGESAQDEIRAAGRVLERCGLRAEVREVRAHPGAEGTRAIVVR